MDKYCNRKLLKLSLLKHILFSIYAFNAVLTSHYMIHKLYVCFHGFVYSKVEFRIFPPSNMIIFLLYEQQNPCHSSQKLFMQQKCV